MDLSKFPESLSDLMVDKNINAASLNDALGFSNSLVNKYLSGNYLPTVDNLIRMANFFNCSTDYLLGIDFENHANTFKKCPPFGEQILFLCEYYKISRYKLRQKTGIAESLIRYWVQGKYQPSLPNILRIAEALDCSVDFVLGREL